MLRLDSTTRQKISDGVKVLAPNCKAYLAGSRSSKSKKLPTLSSDVDVFLFGAARHSDGRVAYKDEALSASISLVANAKVEIFCCVAELESIMTDTMEPLAASTLAHPAGVDLGSTWSGPEVEGVHAKTGLMTLFVASALTADELRKKALECGAKQIFVVEWMTDDEWIASVCIPVASSLDAFVTVARFHDQRESIDFLLTTDARLFVRLPRSLSWLTRLSHHDQFSCGTPFSVVSWSIGDGVETTPDQYMKDRA